MFVHGIGTDQTAWSEVYSAFVENYRLVLLDNVGATPANQAEFRARQLRYLNVRGYGLDLLDICDALGLEKQVTVVGHSLGGLASLLATIERPALFSRLVLIGTSPRYIDDGAYVGGFSHQDVESTYKALQRDYSRWSKNLADAALGKSAPPSLAQRFAETLMSVPSDMMLTVLCSVLQTDQRRELEKIPVPTMVVQAKEDYFVPLAVAEFMQSRIPDCKLKVIDAAGHFPQLTAPDQVISALTAFLRKTL